MKKGILGGIGFVSAIILFTPIPFRYGQVFCYPCVYGKPCPKCPQEGSIGWNPPLIMQLYSRFLRKSDFSRVDEHAIEELTKIKAISLVKEKYPEVRRIEETPQVTIGKTMDIYSKQVGDSWKLLFSLGSGDCEAGCLNDHEWYFIVKSNGDVEKAGEFERIFNSRKNGYDEKGTRIQNFLTKLLGS